MSTGNGIFHYGGFFQVESRVVLSENNCCFGANA